MEHTARRFLFSLKKSVPLFTLLRTASMDLEPDLINMQNKYTRGWYNLSPVWHNVSGGWYIN